jgi:hypothetical protein
LFRIVAYINIRTWIADQVNYDESVPANFDKKISNAKSLRMEKSMLNAAANFQQRNRRRKKRLPPVVHVWIQEKT